MTVMTLAALDQIVELCKNHTVSHQAVAPEIDSLLAQYLIVKIAGVYEEVLEDGIRQRVSRLNDQAITNLVTSLVHLYFRNPNYENLRQLMQKFGRNLVDQLQANSQSEEVDALNSIMTDRHAIAHGKDAKVTMADVVGYYERSKKIINLATGILAAS